MVTSWLFWKIQKLLSLRAMVALLQSIFTGGSGFYPQRFWTTVLTISQTIITKLYKILLGHAISWFRFSNSSHPSTVVLLHNLKLIINWTSPLTVRWNYSYLQHINHLVTYTSLIFVTYKSFIFVTYKPLIFLNYISLIFVTYISLIFVTYL